MIYTSENTTLNPHAFDASKHIDKKDSQFLLEKPEAGFSVARNLKVIKDTMAKHKRIVDQKEKEHEENIRERAHAISYYLFSKALISGKSIEDYLGSKELAYLRGQDISHKLRTANSIVKTPKGLVTLSPQ